MALDSGRQAARGIGRALRLSIGALLGVLGASCLGVLDLEEYKGGPDALCGLLERCYGAAGFAKCRGHVDSQLAVADEAATRAWLEDFDKKHCLDSCQAAWRCLDEKPVCRAPREGCAVDEQCCGFSESTAACVRQSCCRPSHAPCASDADCCASQCVGSPPGCGGPACREKGEACKQSFECCSGLCIPGKDVCSELKCFPDGFTCTQAYECCSGTCAQGTCTGAACAADGEPCLFDGACCTGACDEKLGICGNAGCLPAESPCTGDSDCCAGMFCAPGYARCAKLSDCTVNGASCASGDECCILSCDPNSKKCGCALDGTSCTESYSCCSGACVGGQCGACRKPGETCSAGAECCVGVCKEGACCDYVGCPHAVCATGAPLSPTACGWLGVASTECVKKICDIDPYCCCSQWDDSCAAQVGTVCGLACPPAMP